MKSEIEALLKEFEASVGEEVIKDSEGNETKVSVLGLRISARAASHLLHELFVAKLRQVYGQYITENTGPYNNNVEIKAPIGYLLAGLEKDEG